MNLRTGVVPVVCLAKDDPDAARRHVLDAIAQWSQRSFLLPHWRAMIAEVDADLYGQQGELACHRLAAERMPSGGASCGWVNTCA